MNLLSWPRRSRRVARESVIFTWFSIFLCSDLRTHSLSSPPFPVRFVLFDFQMCAPLSNISHTHKMYDISEYFILVFFSFDRSVKNALCVPLQSFIIFFIWLFVVFPRPHYAVEILCVPPLLLLIQLIWFRVYGSIFRQWFPHAPHTLLNFFELFG